MTSRGCWAEIPVSKPDFGFGLTPQPHTGWTANGEKGDGRRYYCEEHREDDR